MRQEELKNVQQLLSNINTYSHLFKGINLKKEVQSVNVKFSYDDKNNVESVLNDIMFTDGSVIVFSTYEELTCYLRGMSDLIDMIKVSNDDDNYNI